jgi:hypothetical protein
VQTVDRNGCMPYAFPLDILMSRGPRARPRESVVTWTDSSFRPHAHCFSCVLDATPQHRLFFIQ